MENNYFSSLKEYEGMTPGLSRIKKFLESTGKPQDKLKCIHIAGTNGKGSTAAFIAAILQKNGYKTALYTSPHLCNIRERIKVNDINISDTDFNKLAKKNISLAKKNKLSYFEYLTAIAFIYFYKQKVDFAVIETGLGGRFDATNVIKKPLVSVITSISIDHKEILGNSIGKIAFEKAGIIKAGVPVVCGKIPKSALMVLKKKSNPYILGKDFKVKIAGLDSFDYAGLNKRLKSVKISLIGNHQINNAATALCVTEILEKFYNFQDVKTKKALLETKWPARFSAYGKFIIDGAHNKESLNSFIKTLKSYSKNKKHTFVFAMMKEKDYKKAVKLIAILADKVILFDLKNDRAIKPEILKNEFLKYLNKNKILVLKTVDEVVKNTNDKKQVVIAGSLYLAGEFIKNFRGNKCQKNYI